MRTGRSSRLRHVSPARAFSLLECLVYLALYTLLIGIGSLAFCRCLDMLTALHRNAGDIERALQAGELWREDVRSATGPIQIEESDQTVRIPHRQSEVLYRFDTGQVLRKAGRDAPWAVWLADVEQSRMEPDARAHITAWRWELGLKPSIRRVHVRPEFTFIAVPGTPSPP